MTHDLTLSQRMFLTLGRQTSTAIEALDRYGELEKVDDQTQALRITICETCPRFTDATRQCLECGCPMDYKTSLVTNPLKRAAGITDANELRIKCPLDKW